MRIQAAIFDVDSTLADSVDLHAKNWQRVLVEFGKDVSFDEVRSQIGKGSNTLSSEYFDKEEQVATSEDAESPSHTLTSSRRLWAS